MAESALSPEVDLLVREVARAAELAGCSIGSAESLTGGQLSAALTAAPDAGDWYQGGIVAYRPEVKYALLDAPSGPVVTADTAIAMAQSAAALLMADCAVGLTGVGGPEPEEGEAPGTVFIAAVHRGSPPVVARYRFDGDPVAVIEQSILEALRALRARIPEVP